MDKYYPFNAVSGDRRHDADDLALILRSIITNGVVMVNATDLKVLAAGNFGVTVKAGTCVINGRIGVSIADKTLAVAAPTAGLNRIDRIVARADYNNRLVSINYMQGTPASTPTAPALLNTSDAVDIPIARITVNNNAAAITQAMITDERVLSGVLIPNNLEALFSQLNTKFETWFETVQATLDENTAGNLLNLINHNQFVVLWENASPSNNFLAQTLSMDLSAYRFVTVDYAAYKGAVRVTGSTARAAVGENMTLFSCTTTNRTRAITTGVAGLEIADCNRITGYGVADTTVDNAACIPMRIIGYK